MIIKKENSVQEYLTNHNEIMSKTVKIGKKYNDTIVKSLKLKEEFDKYAELGLKHRQLNAEYVKIDPMFKLAKDQSMGLVDQKTGRTIKD